MLASNDQLLNLTCSLVDLEDLSVTHQFLHGIVAVEAVTAEDLNSIRCILISSVTSEKLCDRGEVSISVSSIDLPGRLVSHKSSELGSRSHLSEEERDRLVLDDRLAHRLSLERVLGSFIKSSLRKSSGSSSDWWSGVVESSHGVDEALADFADNVLLWNSYVFKPNTTSVRATLAHVDFLSAWVYTFPFSLDDEASEGLGRWALGVGVSSCKYEVPVGDAAIRDPHLFSVENPFVSNLFGFSFETRNIGSSARLSDTIRSLEA